MNRNDFLALLKRKFSSLAAVVAAAFVIGAVLFALYAIIIRLVPQSVADEWHEWVTVLFHDPAAIRAWLRAKGAAAPWFFVGVQALQVVFAPIPGQAVALAGGFVFGFWKGWALTTLGLAIGSAIAMLLARAFGKKFVRRFVPSSVMNRFDSLIEQGGYMTFFMIFLLPALPDDAVCFIAGLSKLKMLPLSLVCLLGRAPGMAVLSLVGSQLTSGVSTGAKVLFTALMIVSLPLWLFWEIIEEKLAAFALRRKSHAEPSRKQKQTRRRKGAKKGRKRKA